MKLKKNLSSGMKGWIGLGHCRDELDQVVLELDENQKATSPPTLKKGKGAQLD